MKKYDPSKIEKKWQKEWERKKMYQAKDFAKKPKFYPLFEFNYPSGEGLHVGHVRTDTAMDIISRKRRMQGFNVLYPVGWDSFGLPTENYAIKTGISPQLATKRNTDNFRRQIKALGISVDWSREIDTSDPKYYKWTQWIFLRMFKKNLAYKAKIEINWCPKDKIGLANEEVVNGCCERCGTLVEKREKEQWMLAITKYADRLDKDLDTVDYLPQIKIQQRNWIGKSEGTLIKFQITNSKSQIEVFTTRADTLFGVTALILSPEHLWIKSILDEGHKKTLKNADEVCKYINEARKKTDIERGNKLRQKTGIRLVGVSAINPATKEGVPIFVADFVLGSYGTGAIMSVPGHDERDYKFAQVFKLPIRTVIKAIDKKSLLIHISDDDETGAANKIRKISIQREYVTPSIRIYELESGMINEMIKIMNTERVIYKNHEEEIKNLRSIFLENNKIESISVYVGEGILINSAKFNGMRSEEAREKITEKFGKKVVKYKLRDWVFSRQRYWGEPIPLTYCGKCGWQAVPEKDLPIKLPKIAKYKPTDTGESPLALVESWVNVKCPKCKGPARRETDVMPNWAGSSWYYLRYTDPKNNKQIADRKKLKYWTPVDWYNGGMEHTTLHLLYSRFWHKFLFDIGMVPNNEPYKKRTSHGLVLAERGEKMSKSKGNVVNPDDVIKTWGADSLRLYEMFMGPFADAIAWNTDNMIGVRRFLEKVWKLQFKISNLKFKINTKVENLVHKTIKKVTEDIESMSFNTAISSMMILVNELEHTKEMSKGIFDTLLRLLAPFAPHITEELWKNLGNKNSIHLEEWPKWDESKIKEETVNIAIQINGKVRGVLKVVSGVAESEVKNKAISLPEVKKWLEGKEVKKVIFVKDKIINFVLT